MRGYERVTRTVLPRGGRAGTHGWRPERPPVRLDARVHTVVYPAEVARYRTWRQREAARDSMAARGAFAHHGVRRLPPGGRTGRYSPRTASSGTTATDGGGWSSRRRGSGR